MPVAIIGNIGARKQVYTFGQTSVKLIQEMTTNIGTASFIHNMSPGHAQGPPRKGRNPLLKYIKNRNNRGEARFIQQGERYPQKFKVALKNGGK